MSKMPELTAQEMQAARLLLEQGATSISVAAQVDIHERTLRRRMVTKPFLDYQERVRREQDKKLEKEMQSSLKKIGFGKPDLVELLVEIARTPAGETNKRYMDQVAAAKLVADMMGWIPKGPAVEESAPAEPDVFEADWMKNRPS